MKRSFILLFITTLFLHPYSSASFQDSANWAKLELSNENSKFKVIYKFKCNNHSNINDCLCERATLHPFGTDIPTGITSLKKAVIGDYMTRATELILDNFGINELRCVISLIETTTLKSFLRAMIFNKNPDTKSRVETKFEVMLTRLFQQKPFISKNIEIFQYNLPSYNESFINAIIALPNLKEAQLYLSDGYGHFVSTLLRGGDISKVRLSDSYHRSRDYSVLLSKRQPVVLGANSLNKLTLIHRDHWHARLEELTKSPVNGVEIILRKIE